jgi:predicted TIM-barrel fold metal-dependent hydrolase
LPSTGGVDRRGLPHLPFGIVSANLERGCEYRAFDADNHYYEALDAFTRHLDPKLGPRVIQWAEIDGRRYHVIGGRVSRAVVNPTFDPVAKAGALAEYFRGNPSGKLPHEYLAARERIRPEYRDRDARLRTLDEQGLEKVWLFPTLGMIYEELLKHDPEAVTVMFRAFNRWLEEDWGFAYRDRIFAAPYVTLADVDAAVAELEWALAAGARTVVMRPAAPTTRLGQVPPADPSFDPFWALVNESGITVVVHAADSGYTSNGYARDGFAATFEGANRPSIKMLSMERAIYDFLASVIFDRLFIRFPNIRMASVENGSEFLPDLFRKLRSTARRLPGFFPEDPVETFRRHVWINPFWEDDVEEIVGLMGDDRVIFGSDWPHIEALPEPLDYVAELKPFDDDARRRILRDNAEALNVHTPA